MNIVVGVLAVLIVTFEADLASSQRDLCKSSYFKLKVDRFACLSDLYGALPHLVVSSQTAVTLDTASRKRRSAHEDVANDSTNDSHQNTTINVKGSKNKTIVSNGAVRRRRQFDFLWQQKATTTPSNDASKKGANDGMGSFLTNTVSGLMSGAATVLDFGSKMLSGGSGSIPQPGYVSKLSFPQLDEVDSRTLHRINVDNACKILVEKSSLDRCIFEKCASYNLVMKALLQKIADYMQPYCENACNNYMLRFVQLSNCQKQYETDSHQDKCGATEKFAACYESQAGNCPMLRWKKASESLSQALNTNTQFCCAETTDLSMSTSPVQQDELSNMTTVPTNVYMPAGRQQLDSAVTSATHNGQQLGVGLKTDENSSTKAGDDKSLRNTGQNLHKATVTAVNSDNQKLLSKQPLSSYLSTRSKKKRRSITPTAPTSPSPNRMCSIQPLLVTPSTSAPPTVNISLPVGVGNMYESLLNKDANAANRPKGWRVDHLITLCVLLAAYYNTIQ